MVAHYGYIKQTESDADGDHVDVFLGDHPDSDMVYIVDQVKPDGVFDEHKCVLGTNSVDEAKKLYLGCYSADWKGLGAITPMTIDDFKEWIKNGDTGKPVSDEIKQHAMFDFDQDKHPRDEHGRSQNDHDPRTRPRPTQLAQFSDLIDFADVTFEQAEFDNALIDFVSVLFAWDESIRPRGPDGKWITAGEHTERLQKWQQNPLAGALSKVSNPEAIGGLMKPADPAAHRTENQLPHERLGNYFATLATRGGGFEADSAHLKEAINRLSSNLNTKQLRDAVTHAHLVDPETHQAVKPEFMTKGQIVTALYKSLENNRVDRTVPVAPPLPLVTPPPVAPPLPVPPPQQVTPQATPEQPPHHMHWMDWRQKEIQKDMDAATANGTNSPGRMSYLQRLKDMNWRQASIDPDSTMSRYSKQSHLEMLTNARLHGKIIPADVYLDHGLDPNGRPFPQQPMPARPVITPRPQVGTPAPPYDTTKSIKDKIASFTQADAIISALAGRANKIKELMPAYKLTKMYADSEVKRYAVTCKRNGLNPNKPLEPQLATRSEDITSTAPNAMSAGTKNLMRDWRRRFDTANADYKEATAKLEAEQKIQRDILLSHIKATDPQKIQANFGRGLTANTPMKKETLKGLEFVQSILAKAHDVPLNANFIKAGRRAHAMKLYGLDTKIQMGSDSSARTSAHELGHAIEFHMPNAKNLANDFWKSRVGNELPVSMKRMFPGYRYGRSERGRKDEFDKMHDGDMNRAYYTGKIYDDKSTEIIGVETLYHDPAGFAVKDPEYFRFICGVVTGKLRS